MLKGTLVQRILACLRQRSKSAKGSQAFILTLIVPVTLLGQITIDSTEIPQKIGTRWWENNVDSTTVDLGTIGGPHVWDFTAQPMGNDSTLNVIVNKNSTPYNDSFPTANLASLIIGTANDTSFLYQRLTNNSLDVLGGSMTSIVGQVMAVFNPVNHMPLPITYGNTWVSHYGYNVVYMSMSVRIDNYSHCKADAYGTVKIPYGNFECLRLCSYDTMITAIPYILADTVPTIKYYFITKNYGYVASITSKEGETNPNFTEGKLTRLVGFNVGVKESNQMYPELLKASPNPFCSGVSIQYSVVTPGLTSVKIYNASGILIKTLVNGYKTAGNYRVEWNGETEKGEKVTTGIYFYQLRINQENCTKKIILVK